MNRIARMAGLVLVLIAVTVVAAWAECSSYSDLRLRRSDGQVYCGSTGPGCTECYDYNQGGYNGSCVFMPSTGSMVCTDGSGHIYYAN